MSMMPTTQKIMIRYSCIITCAILWEKPAKPFGRCISLMYQSFCDIGLDITCNYIELRCRCLMRMLWPLLLRYDPSRWTAFGLPFERWCNLYFPVACFVLPWLLLVLVLYRRHSLLKIGNIHFLLTSVNQKIILRAKDKGIVKGESWYSQWYKIYIRDAWFVFNSKQWI
jgi:hypothetical protein